MTKSVSFRSKAQIESDQNLAAFIEYAKDKLTVFGDDEFDWNALSWRRVKRSAGLTGTTQTVGWVKLGSSSRSLNPARLDPVFSDFAKANLRYAVSENPCLNLNQRMQALRCLEAALLTASGTANIQDLNIHIANKAAFIAKANYSSGTAYRTAQQLTKIVDELFSLKIVSKPFKWRNPLRRPKCDAIGAEAEARANKKLPTDAVFSALAQAYNKADNQFDLFVTSIITFLAFSHMRVSELYRIDALDCERTKTEIDPQTGEQTEYWGIVFDPSKGNKSYIKWYPHSVSTVARDALRRAIAASAQGREAFKAYEEGRPIDTLPDELTRQSRDGRFPMRALQKLDATIYRKLQLRHGCCINDVVSIEYLLEELVRRMPNSFPYAADTDLQLSRSLMVLPGNQKHLKHTRSPFKPILISQAFLANRLGAKPGQVRNIFDIAGPMFAGLKVTSHQFRHAMTTMLVEGGADELDIARNAGRFRIEDNASYDHSIHSVSRRFMEDSTAEDVLGQTVVTSQATPIDLQDVLTNRINVSHLTEFGYCDLSWSGSPCSLFRDCVNCSHNICIKGDLRAEKNLRLRYSVVAEQLRRADRKMQAGHKGGGRWYEHHKKTLKQLEKLIAILDDPAVPMGTTIRPISEKDSLPLHVQSEASTRRGNHNFLENSAKTE